MRDRLIEILEQHCLLRHDVLECSAGKGIGECSDCLANWLLENGVIVPPCKVGDTVYKVMDIESVHRQILEMKVLSIEIGKTSKVYAKTVKKYRYNYSTIDFSEFGKTVFLTREEAEKALKGGEG